MLVHYTDRSGLRMAAAVDHMVEGPAGTETFSESFDDLAQVIVAADVPRGERLRIIKFIAYGWSHRRTTPALPKKPPR